MVEAATTLVGYGLGDLAKSHHLIASFDHWIAFILLSALSIHLLYDSAKNEPTSTVPALTLVTAIATSVDALVVGVSLALVHVSIWQAVLCIGLVTWVVASVGAYIGSGVGQRNQTLAQRVGGCLLFAIGVWILLHHLTD